MERGKRISSSWGVSINIMLPVLFLEFIPDFLIAQNIMCNIGEFWAEVLWRKRKELLFYYYCNAPAHGQGTLLCCFLQTQDKTLISLQWVCNLNVRGKVAPRCRKGVHAYITQTPTLVGEEYWGMQKATTLTYPFLCLCRKHTNVWFWSRISMRIMRFSLATRVKPHPTEEEKKEGAPLKI